jgi:fructose 1,6-bisphosphatase
LKFFQHPLLPGTKISVAPRRFEAAPRIIAQVFSKQAGGEKIVPQKGFHAARGIEARGIKSGAGDGIADIVIRLKAQFVF